MNKLDLARRLARESHRSSGKAADDVDALVYKILKNLKKPAGAPPSTTPIGPIAPKPDSKEQP